MRSKRCAVTTARLLAAAVLSAIPLEAGSGFDRSDARTFELERDLRSVRPRVERAPGRSSLALKDLQRRLHDRQIEDPRDPGCKQAEIELRHLRAKADRTARRPATAAVLPRSSPLSTPAPIERPVYLGGAHTPVAAAPARPYFGQRVVALQRSVAEMERRLAERDTAAVARLLEAAEADLAVLRGALSDAIANDPNLIVLEDQIGAIKERLAPGR
jgi:hypothetical protein